MKTKQAARVVAETLTDGSIVFNVMQGDEEIAAPPSYEEARQICDAFNRRELLQAEIQRRIFAGELEATDGDDIHDDPRSWRHQ